MRTGAVVVAAGHKSSVSSFSPMLPIGDSTVIRRIIITLKRSGIDPVVVVTGKQGDEVEKHIAGLRVICLRNQNYGNTQMYNSICLGLNYIEDLCDRVFILPAKFPMFLPETIKRMMDMDAQVVCPVFEGRRGHPVLVSSNIIGKLLNYKGEKGLRGALRQADGVGPVVGFVGNPLTAQIVALAVTAGDDPLGLVEFPPLPGPVEGHLFAVFGVVVAVADEIDRVLPRKEGHRDPSVFIQNNGFFNKGVPDPVHDEGAQGAPHHQNEDADEKDEPLFVFHGSFPPFISITGG